MGKTMVDCYTTLMKIYFAGSIRAGRQDADIYKRLISGLQEFSQVLTEHIGSNLPVTGEKLPVESIFQRDCAWIAEADCVVAEVTQPSTGVGYEIGLAESLGKKVYCLFRPGNDMRVSAMVEGNPSCTLLQYTETGEVARRLRTLLVK